MHRMDISCILNKKASFILERKKGASSKILSSYKSQCLCALLCIQGFALQFTFWLGSMDLFAG